MWKLCVELFLSVGGEGRSNRIYDYMCIYKIHTSMHTCARACLLEGSEVKWDLPRTSAASGSSKPGEVPKVGGLAEFVAFHG
jgi:hypothetical protein